MPVQRYTYLLEIFQGQSTPAGRMLVTPDWEPMLQCAWLQGLRRGDLQPTDGMASSAVEPRFHSTLGAPRIEGFRVTILSEHGNGVSEDFDTTYFSKEARAATLELLKQGVINRDDRTEFLVSAFYDDNHARTGPASPFKVREESPELPVHPTTLADHIDSPAVSLCDADQTQAGDVPVVIPARIFDEIRDQTRAAGARETGGILIGNLHRDDGAGELLVEVTAQIPAIAAPAQIDRLSFTPETWTAVQAAIDLRGEGEIYLGWTHTHPVHEWCKECDPEKKRDCAVAQGFLSSHDVQLHRSVFPRAYCVALLASDVDAQDDVRFSLYGWRRGAIERRGYHVRNDVNAKAHSKPNSRGGN
jgi:hypothetical protein